MQAAVTELLLCMGEDPTREASHTHHAALSLFSLPLVDSLTNALNT
jgi:hypothetical protein